MQPTIADIRRFLATHSPSVVTTPGLRRSAVLFSFIERPDGLQILLTRRTDNVEHHKGQVAFPGGMMDEGDEHEEATALREAEEEIGLDRSIPELLGRSDQIETPSGFVVTPVVALLRREPELLINPDEVDDAFFVPVSLFFDPSVEQVEQRSWKGKLIDVYTYPYRGNRIWGATAFMIRTFLRQVMESGTEKP